jgi:S-adenosylmethionine synthetase
MIPNSAINAGKFDTLPDTVSSNEKSVLPLRSDIAKPCSNTLGAKCSTEGILLPVLPAVNVYSIVNLSAMVAAEIVKDVFDFRPSKIISKLDLLRPIYRATASYGHFGRDEAGFSWEKLDMAETLKNYL